MSVSNSTSICRRWIALALPVALALAQTAPAIAVTPDEWAACHHTDRDHAIKACTQIETNPKTSSADRASAIYSRGVARSWKRDYAGAIADYTASLKLRPQHEATLSSRGNAHRSLRQFDQALADYDAILKIDPNSLRGLRGRASILRERRNYAGALELLNRAVAAKPDAAEAIRERGDTHRLAGAAEEAIRDYIRAVELNPKDNIAHNNHGLALVILRRFQAAVEQYTKAISFRPDDPVAHTNRGISNRRLGNFTQAFADFDRSIALKPDNIQAITQRGNLRIIVRDYAGAKADAEAALAMPPSDQDPQFVIGFAHNVRGLARQGLKDLPGALQDLEEAVRRQPRSAIFLTNRGEIHEQSGNAAKALADYTAAIDLKVTHPDDAVAQNRARQLRDVLSVALPPSKAGPGDPAAKPPVSILAGVPKSKGGRKIALVIGNSGYKFADKLINPRNDAADVAATLRKLGFAEVFEHHDLTLDQLTAELKRFGDLSEKADWAVIYYAGHGMEVDGINYIVPIDASLKKASHIGDEAMPLERLVSKVEGASKLRLVILDACRNNPFAKKAERDSRVRTIGKGLASIEPEAGTLIAFAARGGTEALDGDGRNSPYATHLLRHIQEPGLDIRFVFDKVRDGVRTTTDKAQVPFTYGSLPPEQFILKE